jgi:hypothetical protein
MIFLFAFCCLHDIYNKSCMHISFSINFPSFLIFHVASMQTFSCLPKLHRTLKLLTLVEGSRTATRNHAETSSRHSEFLTSLIHGTKHCSGKYVKKIYWISIKKKSFVSFVNENFPSPFFIFRRHFPQTFPFYCSR